MRRLSVWSVVVLVVMLAVYFRTGQTPAGWTVFTNRAGWSISYPPGWRISSCRSCPDPAEAGVFVNFFPSGNYNDGWVIVQQLNRPSARTIDDSLLQLSNEVNLNPKLRQQRILLNGHRALLSLAQNPFGKSESETVYVVAGPQTFSISFVAFRGSALTQPNYHTYRQMLRTFRLANRPI
ncbi:MAG: hypothetical protein HY545_01090 [Candidatus Doudnabacteria bacterium]|nr:hypothetical protein [Candidatus Doudnabacteria bacterium]